MILFNKAEPFFNLLYLQNGMSDIIYKEAMQYAFPLFSLYLSREKLNQISPLQFSRKMKIDGKCLNCFIFISSFQRHAFKSSLSFCYYPKARQY